MTPAALKTKRQACGLSTAWLAARAGVREQTVTHWEAGRMAVPGDVAALVASVDAMLEAAADQAGAQARALVDQHSLDNQPLPEISLVRYREDQDLWAHRGDMAGLPANCHAMLIARAVARMEALGLTCRIVWLEPKAYRVWLAEQGQTDSEELRAAWAAEQPDPPARRQVDQP